MLSAHQNYRFSHLSCKGRQVFGIGKQKICTWYEQSHSFESSTANGNSKRSRQVLFHGKEASASDKIIELDVSRDAQRMSRVLAILLKLWHFSINMIGSPWSFWRKEQLQLPCSMSNAHKVAASDKVKRPELPPRVWFCFTAMPNSTLPKLATQWANLCRKCSHTPCDCDVSPSDLHVFEEVRRSLGGKFSHLVL